MLPGKTHLQKLGLKTRRPGPGGDKLRLRMAGGNGFAGELETVQIRCTARQIQPLAQHCQGKWDIDPRMAASPKERLGADRAIAKPLAYARSRHAAPPGKIRLRDDV
jgi:hypothetical protein